MSSDISKCGYLIKIFLDAEYYANDKKQEEDLTMSLAGARNSHQDIRHLLEKATQMPSFCMRIKLFLHLPSQCSLWFCDLKDMAELERR